MEAQVRVIRCFKIYNLQALKQFININKLIFTTQGNGGECFSTSNVK